MAMQLQDVETKEMAERLEKTLRREKILVTNVRKYEGMMTEYSKVINQEKDQLEGIISEKETILSERQKELEKALSTIVELGRKGNRPLALNLFLCNT